MPTASPGANGLSLGAPAPVFSLPDPKGRTHALKDFGDAKGLLVIFMCNHCPYVKHLKKPLVEFAARYQPRGLGIVAINSNDWRRHPDDSPDAMQKDTDAFGYQFPYVVDESQAVAKAYGAVCTPEFYLFDAARKLTYHGRFDDSSPGNGKPVTGAELSAAADAVLSGEPFARAQNAAMGCSIKWR